MASDFDAFEYKSYFRVAEKRDILENAWSFKNGEARIELPLQISSCISDFSATKEKRHFAIHFLADFDIYATRFPFLGNPLTYLVILALMLNVEKVFLTLEKDACVITLSEDKFDLQRSFRFFRREYFLGLCRFIEVNNIFEVNVSCGPRNQRLSIKVSDLQFVLSTSI